MIDKIADSELEVLKILWREKRAVSSTEIRNELQESKGWERTTILTLLRRLTDKNIINAEKGNVFQYTTNVSKEEYANYQTQGIIDKLYGGNAKSLVATLCRASKITEDDINDLRNYFKVGDDK